MQNQINLSPITQFIQIIRSAELSQSKEIKLPITQARLLNLALAELLDKVNQDYETLLKNLQKSTGDTVTVQLDGGGFSNQ